MKTKAILTIVICLLTGFILGFFVAGQIGRWRTRDVHSMSSTEAFKMRTYGIITPTPEQEKLIAPIVEEYAVKADSMKRESWKAFGKFFDEYHGKLEPYLDGEQIQKLREFPKHKKDRHSKENKAENDSAR